MGLGMYRFTIPTIIDIHNGSDGSFAILYNENANNPRDAIEPVRYAIILADVVTISVVIYDHDRYKISSYI